MCVGSVRSTTNYHLIVAHVETDEAGILDDKVYEWTKYTGDMTVIVRPRR